MKPKSAIPPRERERDSNGEPGSTADGELASAPDLPFTASTIEVALGRTGEVKSVGPYAIVGTLGRGGMGIVYEVREEPTGTVYALKTIEARFLALPENQAARRFSQEIALLESLDHPGIVRLHDAGLARHPHRYDLAFFVTERLRGHALSQDLQKGGAIVFDEALRITGAVADALVYLESRDVQHRDIKPSNIFLDEGGRVVLIDFGLARSQEFTRLTTAGTVVGTFGYISPERHLSLPSGISSDVYSLGVVLYRMILGSHPFETEELAEILLKIRRGVPWNEDLLQRTRGEGVARLIDGMLAFDPELRLAPKTVKSAVEELRGAAKRRVDLLVPPLLIEELPSVRARVEKTKAVRLQEESVGAALERSAGSPTAAGGSLLDAVHSVPARGVGDGARVATKTGPGPDARAENAVSWTQPGISPRDPTTPIVGPTSFGRVFSGGQLALIAGATFALGLLAGLWLRDPDASIAGGSAPATPLARRLDEPRPARRAIALADESATGAAKAAEPVPAARTTLPSVPTPVRPEENEKPVRPPKDLVGRRSDRALEFDDPQKAFAHGERAEREGRFEEALRAFQRAVALNPAFAMAHRRLGDAQWRAGNKRAASQHYMTYLALRPRAPDAAEVQKRLDVAPLHVSDE